MHERLLVGLAERHRAHGELVGPPGHQGAADHQPRHAVGEAQVAAALGYDIALVSLGALILGNAVIGNAPAEERRFPLLRYGAMGLGAVMLPLAVLAAIATGLRIGQYGFTPERLWAVVFVAIACLWGAAYLVALVRGRLNWSARVRPLNLTLAFIVCGVALVLATPLVSFNAISTRDQVARLESGRTSPEQFDWIGVDASARGKGVVFVYGNYSGDTMNFDMAAEFRKALEEVEKQNEEEQTLEPETVEVKDNTEQNTKASTSSQLEKELSEMTDAKSTGLLNILIKPE